MNAQKQRPAAATNGAGKHVTGGATHQMHYSKLDRARSALHAIDPNIDRDTWVRVAMAAAAAGLGFDDFDSWSQSGQSYNAAAARSTWRSIRPDGGIGAGTLFAKAQESGWQGDMPTAAERDAMAKRARRQRQQFEQQRRQRQQEVAEQARKLWEAASEADPQHAYLQDKMVQPYGLRQDGDCLLVPLTDGGSLVNLQRIFPVGSKRFLRGGRVHGCYSPIGGGGGHLYIAEGWATGATVHAVTGCAVVCAINAGNLATVAMAIRRQFPGRHILIAADNDSATPGNPGVTAAYKAARAIGAEVKIPEFPDGSHGTDWNDYYQLEKKGAI